MIAKKIFLSLSMFFATASLVEAQTPAPTTPAAGTTLRMNASAPSGVSSFVPATTGTTTTYATIYGSYTGAVGACATPTPGDTCNSCTAAKNACSLTSIHPSLLLTIPLISNTATVFQGQPVLKYKFGTDTALYSVPSPPTLVVGQPFNAQIPWSALCVKMGGNTDCTGVTSGTYSFLVGIDNDNDGDFEEKVDFNIKFRFATGLSTITQACVPPAGAQSSSDGVCFFKVTKGDEKVYIVDFAAADNSLVTSDTDIKFDRMVMFYETGAGGAQIDPAAVTPASPSHVVTLQNNGASVEPGIEDRRIRGLTNGLEYCFMVGSMDQTGIVSKFLSGTAADRATVCATPEVVVGLLDDKSCFIATATFGSPMAPEVVTFREFRNKFLLTNSAGKWFVKNYYKYGPVAARWISDVPALKLMSLGLLWPLLLFVKLSLHLGLTLATLFAFMTAVGVFQLISRARRNRARAV